MTVPAEPDLPGRLLHLTVIRTMAAKPELLFRAWAEQFDRWFDALGSVLMRGEVDSPFYFETHFEGERHPLRAIPYRPPQASQTITNEMSALRLEFWALPQGCVRGRSRSLERLPFPIPFEAIGLSRGVQRTKTGNVIER